VSHDYEVYKNEVLTLLFTLKSVFLLFHVIQKTLFHREILFINIEEIVYIKFNIPVMHKSLGVGLPCYIQTQLVTGGDGI